MRFAGLNVFTAALRCVPYIVPEHWNGARLMDDLPGKRLKHIPWKLCSNAINAVITCTGSLLIARFYSELHKMTLHSE